MTKTVEQADGAHVGCNNLVTRLWVVGRVHFRSDLPDDLECMPWEFQGVFDDEAKATAACRDTSYFIGPADLNVKLPHDTFQWDGAYFPHTRKSVLVSGVIEELSG